jgi:hypothetical protein
MPPFFTRVRDIEQSSEDDTACNYYVIPVESFGERVRYAIK